jgi:hypothetical protein
MFVAATKMMAESFLTSSPRRAANHGISGMWDQTADDIKLTWPTITIAQSHSAG